MSTRLELRFATNEEKNRTLAINNPVLSLEPEVVQTAMQSISEQGLFELDGEVLYNRVIGARYVTRTVDDIFEVE